MSPRTSRKGPAAAPDVYVTLLYVSVASLVIGISLLYMELGMYEFKMP
jgi:hypothetical protein